MGVPVFNSKTDSGIFLACSAGSNTKMSQLFTGEMGLLREFIGGSAASRGRLPGPPLAWKTELGWCSGPSIGMGMIVYRDGRSLYQRRYFWKDV